MKGRNKRTKIEFELFMEKNYLNSSGIFFIVTILKLKKIILVSFNKLFYSPMIMISKEASVIMIYEPPLE